jgi:hypothetical protein
MSKCRKGHNLEVEKYDSLVGSGDWKFWLPIHFTSRFGQLTFGVLIVSVCHLRSDGNEWQTALKEVNIHPRGGGAVAPKTNTPTPPPQVAPTGRTFDIDGLQRLCHSRLVDWYAPLQCRRSPPVDLLILK